jgi:hypothetical protein
MYGREEERKMLCLRDDRCWWVTGGGWLFLKLRVNRCQHLSLVSLDEKLRRVHRSSSGGKTEEVL